MNDLTDCLEVLSAILLRCLIGGLVVILVWFFFYILTGETGYALSSVLFRVTRHEYDLLNYFGMGFLKVMCWFFFILPYIAVRLVIAKRRRG